MKFSAPTYSGERISPPASPALSLLGFGGLLGPSARHSPSCAPLALAG